jgi:hypothetical protein
VNTVTKLWVPDSVGNFLSGLGSVCYLVLNISASFDLVS